MKLRELMEFIVKPKGPWTQTVAESKTGIAQWKLSNFKNADDNSEYEKSWQDFLKLLRFCRQRGIDPAQDLLERHAEKGAIDATKEIAAGVSSAFAPTLPRQAALGKRTATGAVSPRRDRKRKK